MTTNTETLQDDTVGVVGLIGSAAAAKYLGIAVATLYKACQSGRLPNQKVGMMLAFRKEWLDAYKADPPRAGHPPCMKPCPACQRPSQARSKRAAPCPLCGGRGEITTTALRRYEKGPPGRQPTLVTCPSCRGQGCELCDDSGKTPTLTARKWAKNMRAAERARLGLPRQGRPPKGNS